MSVQVGDIYTIEIHDHSNNGNIFIIVRPLDGRQTSGWETYNLTTGRYEWDYDSAFLDPYIYRKLA